MFDNGRSATQGGFNAMGAPLLDITAVIVTFLELMGELTLILGVLTPIVGALLAIDMLGAFFLTHMGTASLPAPMGMKWTPNHSFGVRSFGLGAIQDWRRR